MSEKETCCFCGYPMKENDKEGMYHKTCYWLCWQTCFWQQVAIVRSMFGCMSSDNRKYVLGMLQGLDLKRRPRND